MNSPSFPFRLKYSYDIMARVARESMRTDSPAGTKYYEPSAVQTTRAVLYMDYCEHDFKRISLTE